ncbi:MAG: UPF0104 family protein [Actinobacteria bacterium]|nr:UPF0104 family protein [Actinomycetota bacterium]
MEPHRSTTSRPNRWHIAVGALAVVGLVAFVLLERQSVVEALRQVRDIDLTWLTLGLITSILSIALFAAVRVVLLDAAGGRLRLGEATTASFASGAIAATVPGGGALATAYMIQRYRDAGTDAAGATWVTVASGVVAPAVLVAATLIGFAILGQGTLTVIVPALMALFLLGGFFWVTRRPQVLLAPTHAVVQAWRKLRRRDRSDAESVAEEFVERFGEIRAGGTRWASVWVLQVLSWAGEFVTLVASIVAVGGEVPWLAILAAYGTSQLAGAIPLVPGGAGQVEATLVVALTGAGMDTATALAAAVVFRIGSHWLVVPIGWGCLAVDRRRRRPT